MKKHQSIRHLAVIKMDFTLLQKYFMKKKNICEKKARAAMLKRVKRDT